MGSDGRRESDPHVGGTTARDYPETHYTGDLNVLFTNDKLKQEPATIVFRSDPFCIPRATDNVPEYRPKFNPLSILEREESLLPRYFRIDPSEGIPGIASKNVFNNRETSSPTNHKERELHMNSPVTSKYPTPARCSASDNTFMGTLPRQPMNDSIASPLDIISDTAASSEYFMKSYSFRSQMNTGCGKQTSLFNDDSPSNSALSTNTIASTHPINLAEKQAAMYVNDGLISYLPDRTEIDIEVRQVQPLARFESNLLGNSELANRIPHLLESSNDVHELADIAAMSSLSEQSSHFKKIRTKNSFRPCTAFGCTKGARGKSGLCQKHGGGKRCIVASCPKGAQGSSNMCLFHGGGYRCTVDGCKTGARGTSGLCAKHGGYKRVRDCSLSSYDVTKKRKEESDDIIE